MHESYSSQQQSSSVAAATMMLSQCSLQDRNEVLPNNNCYVVGQFSNDSVNGPATSRIQRRNAVGNLFEGIDVAVIKQLAELNDQKVQ